MEKLQNGKWKVKFIKRTSWKDGEIAAARRVFTSSPRGSRKLVFLPTMHDLLQLHI